MTKPESSLQKLCARQHLLAWRDAPQFLLQWTPHIQTWPEERLLLFHRYLNILGRHLSWPKLLLIPFKPCLIHYHVFYNPEERKKIMLCWKYYLVVLNEEMASLPMREEGRTQLTIVTVARNWPGLKRSKVKKWSHTFTDTFQSTAISLKWRTMSCCTAGHLGSGVGQPDLNQYLPSLGLTVKMGQGN